VAGARDIGVMQTAEIASDRASLAHLKGPAVDALYVVQGVGRTNVSATPVSP
jgi:hypothetical protein